LEKEVSCRVSNALIRYVESNSRDTTSLFEGLSYSKVDLENPLNWITPETRDILAERAANILNNEKVMYQIGLETPTQKPMAGLDTMIRLFGSPQIAYANISRFYSFFDRTVRFEVDILKENFAIVRMIPEPNYSPSIQACYFTQGILTSIPVLWNLAPAEIQEFKCGCKSRLKEHQTEIGLTISGCLYEINWQSPKSKTRTFIDNNIFRANRKTENPIKVLESSYALLDQKNSELTQRNLQLSKVREIAEGIDLAKSTEDVFKFIVNLSMDIPQISFAMVQKADPATGYLTTPYFSKFRDENMLQRLKAIGFDLVNQFGKHPESTNSGFKLSNLPVINEYLRNPRIMVADRLSQVLTGLWSPRICDRIQEEIGFKKIVIVPLKVDHQSAGSLLFYLNADLPMDILEMIGTHCSIALKNVMTLQSLERRNRELTAVNSIAGQTMAETDLAKIIRRSISEMMTLFSATSVSIHLLDEKEDKLRMIDQEGMPEKIIDMSRIIDKNSPFGKILASNSDLLKSTMNAYSDEYPQFADLIPGQSQIFLLTIPLITQAKRSGIATITRNNHGFEEDEESLFKSIGHQLSIAIENAMLHENLVTRIHELESTKNNLADSEEKMRLTLEAASEAIMVTASDGKIIQANDEVINLHGYTNDRDFIGTNALNYVDYIDRHRMMENLKNIQEGGTFKKGEYTLIRKDGSRFPAECSISAFNNSLGQFQGFVICFRDISKRQEAEALLKESERKYRLIAENTNDLIAVVNFSGNYQYVSPSYNQMGYDPNQMIGKQSLDYIHPEDKYYIQRLNMTGFNPKVLDSADLNRLSVSQLIEFRFKDSTGNWHNMEASGNLIETPDGKGFNILMIARDITARKQAQEELEILFQAEKNLRFALEKEINTRAEFFRAVVHELKTPLTPIVASSETMMDLIEDKMFKKLAENVFKGAIRLNTRVDELLDMSRGELGILKLDRQPMDPGLLIRDVADYIKAQTTNNKQNLLVDVPDSLPHINADESRLRQVLLNLLDNAMKFTPQGGQIYLRAKCDMKNLIVEVQDTGRGIDESEQARLFKPYNRIEEDRQHFSGLGLGLALSKQLIELHGGQLKVCSQKGQGSTFTFVLSINAPCPN
jgi:PAS domain S-box-containing protein